MARRYAATDEETGIDLQELGDELTQLVTGLYRMLLCERGGYTWVEARVCFPGSMRAADRAMGDGLVRAGLAVESVPRLRPRCCRLTAVGRQRAEEYASSSTAIGRHS